jgi:hypothetical protein
MFVWGRKCDPCCNAGAAGVVASFSPRSGRGAQVQILPLRPIFRSHRNSWARVRQRNDPHGLFGGQFRFVTRLPFVSCGKFSSERIWANVVVQRLERAHLSKSAFMTNCLGTSMGG